MEVKITPKSCIKLLLWLKSQVKETKLFCDGQTKAQGEGELDPAYGNSNCLLALLTVRACFRTTQWTSFLEQSAQPAAFPSASSTLPPIPSRTDAPQASPEGLWALSQWSSLIQLPRWLTHTPARPPTALQDSKCQSITQPFKRGLAVSRTFVLNIKAQHSIFPV